MSEDFILYVYITLIGMLAKKTCLVISIHISYYLRIVFSVCLPHFPVLLQHNFAISSQGKIDAGYSGQFPKEELQMANKHVNILNLTSDQDIPSKTAMR